MSGYRDKSGFDPMAGGSYGPPLRPYNWVQWTGVACGIVGIAIDLVYLGGQAGLTRKLLDSPSLGVALPFFGVMLVNSRRQEVPLSPDAKRRNTVIILVALAVCLAVAALVIYLKGA